MATAVTTRQAPEWRKPFIAELEADKHLDHQSMKAYFKDFEIRNPGVSWSAASFYFYSAKRSGEFKHIKDHPGYNFTLALTPDAGVNISVTKAEPTPYDFKKLDRLMTQRPGITGEANYQVGQTVKVVITGLEVYGAFAETQDGHKTPGLIHKSNIAYARITDPAHYFAYGDVHEVEVMKVEKDGKLSYSTKGLGLKPVYQSNIGSSSSMIVKNDPVKEPCMTPDHPDEKKEVYQYLTSLVGMLTPAAQAKINALIETYGMFRFTKILTQVESSFQRDLGVALALHIEHSISQRL